MPVDSLTHNHYSKHPLVTIAASFAVGIIFAKYLDLNLIVLATFLVLAVGTAWILREKGTAAFALLLAFAAAGGICYLAEVNGVSDNRLKLLYDRGSVVSGDALDLEGGVKGGIEPAIDGYFFTLASERITYKSTSMKVAGNVRIFVPFIDLETERDINDLQISHGSRLLVACRPIREEQFQNLGVRSKRASLDEQGIDATATLKSPLLIENLGMQMDLNPLASVYDSRRKLIDSFRENLGPTAAGVMIASLLGDKYFVDKNTADIFREGGTFHILIISGLHITFLGAMLLLIVSRFTGKRMLQFVICSIVLWSYTIAVGADIPVVRACIVFTMLLFSRIVYRTPSLLNTLGACALILLVYHPSSLFTASFQLTFVSVGAIVAIAFPLIEKMRSIGRWMPAALQPFPAQVWSPLKRFAETLYWRDSLWEHEVQRHIWSANLFKSPLIGSRPHPFAQSICAYLFEGLLVSLIIQICLLPLSVVHFHRVSFAGLFLNIWVGVLLAVESFVAVFAVLLSQISETLAFPVFRITDILNSLLLFFPGILSEAGWASFRIPHYSGAGFLIYFVYFLPLLMLATAIYRWEPFGLIIPADNKRWNMIAAAALAVLAAMIIAHPLSEPLPDGKLRVDFLDVGQGDSALVTFPDGQTMLVDGGGRIDFRRAMSKSEDVEPVEKDVPGIGEAVVSPYLWHRGYSDIDYVIATHAHADHVQGLAEIASNFDIQDAFIGRSYAGDADSFSKAIARRNINLRTLVRGDSFQIAGVTIDVVSPNAGSFDAAATDNDESVVIRLTFGKRSILLTGDIERKTEAELTAGDVSLSADVVKVPHHGSRTSSTQAFVDATGAQYAIISVGRRSTFGHPHADVVERWRTAGAEVMTTGERGTITVTTDGTSLSLETFIPQN